MGKVADLNAGLISIGAVALSTALGGWILARFNLRPRTAMRALLTGWSVLSFGSVDVDVALKGTDRSHLSDRHEHQLYTGTFTARGREL